MFIRLAGSPNTTTSGCVDSYSMSNALSNEIPNFPAHRTCAHLHVLFFQKNQIIGKFSVTLFYGFDHDFTYVGDTL